MTRGLLALADSLVLLHGWRRWGAAFVAGIASVLAMPPIFLAPILLITLPVLVLLLDGADADPIPSRKRKRFFAALGPSFAVGWWFGFGYFLAGLYWIAEALLVNASAHAWLIPFALTLIPGGLALFIALPCALAARFWSTGFVRVGMLASLLAAFEALRGVVLTGFPWNGFHSALGLHDALLQGLSVLGPLAASFLVLLVAMIPAALWPREVTGRGSRIAALGCLLVFGLWAGFGVLRLASADATMVDGVTMRIVQPNIAQVDKWDPDLREAHVATLLELTTRHTGADRLGVLGVSHVVWPESAFPFLLTQRPDVLRAIGSALPLGAQMLAGAVRAEPRGAQDRAFYNSVYAFNDRGEIIDAYDKARLVPFGEVLPFDDLIDRLGLRPLVSAPAGFEPGVGPGVLSGSSGPVALALVCYEAIFPGFVRAGARTHTPDYLLNVTNDAWFGTSAGPRQHFFQARLRAVETGLPLVRAANTGISAVIDPYGQVIAELGIDQQGIIDAPLPQALSPSHYVHFGDAPFLGILALVLSLCFYYQRKQKPVLA
ncbi:MAG: apolipoprotein N-acyltransferase [Hyphomicrobiales bacterium]|jgi:apolipoprotein N-acyltransferase